MKRHHCRCIAPLEMAWRPRRVQRSIRTPNKQKGPDSDFHVQKKENPPSNWFLLSRGHLMFRGLGAVHFFFVSISPGWTVIGPRSSNSSPACWDAKWPRVGSQAMKRPFLPGSAEQCGSNEPRKNQKSLLNMPTFLLERSLVPCDRLVRGPTRPRHPPVKTGVTCPSSAGWGGWGFQLRASRAVSGPTPRGMRRSGSRGMPRLRAAWVGGSGLAHGGCARGQTGRSRPPATGCFGGSYLRCESRLVAQVLGATWQGQTGVLFHGYCIELRGDKNTPVRHTALPGFHECSWLIFFSR